MNHDEEEGEIGGPGNNTSGAPPSNNINTSHPPSGASPPGHPNNGPPDNNAFRPRFPPPSRGRGGGGGGRHFHGIGYRGAKPRESSFGGRGGFAGRGGGRGGDFRGPGGNEAPFRDDPPFRNNDGPFNRPGFRDGPPPSFRSSDRGRSGSIHREGSFGGGPPPPFNRDGSYTGPPRDYNAPFSGGGPGGAPIPDREPSFGRDMQPRDLNAPPPRGPPFRRDSSGPPPFRRGDSQSSFSEARNLHSRPFGDHIRRDSSGLLPGGPPAPQDPRRPTDPRRRSSQDLSGIASAAMDNGPMTGSRNLPEPPMPSPHPPSGRRLSSYSSLADASTMPSNLIASAEPLDQGFRSPAGRQNSNSEFSKIGHSGSTPLSVNNSASRSSSWSSPMPERRGSGPPVAPSLSNCGPSHAFRDTSSGPEVSTSSGPPPPFARNRSFNEETDPYGRVPRSSSFSNQSPRNTSPSRAKPIKSFGGAAIPGSVSKPLIVERVSSVASETSRQANTSEAKKLETPSTPLPTASSDPPKPTLPPLKTTSLGEGDIVERAEIAVLHLSEVLLDASIKNASGTSQLPEKQQIMAAVTQIESQIKLAQSKLDNAQENYKHTMEEEARQEERENKRMEEKHAQLTLEKEERAREEERLERELKAQGLSKALSEHQAKFDDARESHEAQASQKVAAAVQASKEAYNLDVKVEEAEQNFGKDIFKARTSLEKAKSNSLKVEAKLVTAQSEYETLLEIAKAQEDQSKNRSNEGKGKKGSEMSLLAERIMVENQRKARESQTLGIAMASGSDEASGVDTGSRDPVYGRSFEEWSVMAKQVTGFADALFPDPSDTPYFKKNERDHELLAPSVKEYIRDRKKRLMEEWTVLAEEYEVRKRLYEKQQRKLAKKARSGSVSVSRKSIMAGDTESAPSGVAQGIDRSNILESGSRTSSNPYRRARRGNEVRSEYEQEQIIAELAAKEAMEKRITHGGCAVTRQVSSLERGITASFIHTFNSHRIDDMKKEAEESRMDNIWTDMEKCIFLDRFLQFPKDFRRIASFLRNKTTKDCIAFYYDSKQTVPYKSALKEHVMRRKRKGSSLTWDASVQAAISVGATVSAGDSEDNPVVFALPQHDKSYRTIHLHPLRRETLDPMIIDQKAARKHEREIRADESKGKSRKRARDPLFSLEKRQAKFLRQESQESLVVAPTDARGAAVSDTSETPLTPSRKTPQKWTAVEKKIFVETLEKHGRDWAKLAQAVGSKNEKQIKNFYYDWKKGKSRPPVEKKAKKEKGQKLRKPNSKSEENVPSISQEKAVENSEVNAEVKSMADPAPEQQESNGVISSQAATTDELRAQAELIARHRGVVQLQSMSGTTTPDNDYGGNAELIQQLLNQQLQQHTSHQNTQSTLQQLLSQQHLQRESQFNHLSLEDTRRLLSHHQNQPHSVLSNSLASQWMLQQGQGGGFTSNAITAALRGETGGLGGMHNMSDLQHLLQMQRASQGLGMANHQHNHLSSLLLGGRGDVNPSANSNLSAALLQQLAAGHNGLEASEHLASLANAQQLLGFGAGNGAGANLGNAFYHQGGGGGGMDANSGVADAFSLIARSMQRNDNGDVGNGLGRHDNTGRYN